MATVGKYYNLDTDATLSGNSDTAVASQKAIKTYIDNNAGGGGSSRNIGEMVSAVLPLSDEKLHLLDGSVLDGTIYTTLYQRLIELSGSNPNYITNEEDWQDEFNTYGVCGKFAINTYDKTVRLPNITGIVEGSSSVSELGNAVAPGTTSDIGQRLIHETATEYFDESLAGNNIQPLTVKILYYMVVK